MSRADTLLIIWEAIASPVAPRETERDYMGTLKKAKYHKVTKVGRWDIYVDPDGFTYLVVDPKLGKPMHLGVASSEAEAIKFAKQGHGQFKQ